MEKLQAAIQKAREQRDGSLGDRPLPAPGEPRTDGPLHHRRTHPIGRRDAEPTADEIAARWEGLPELTITSRQGRRNRLFLDGNSPEAAYFDKLRTKVLQLARDNAWRRIVITSPDKSCGKTTIASNLAASFTRQRDRRVLLLELDMRRPGMAQVFRYQPACSFSDVLEERDSFAACAARLGGNVAIGMNGAPHPNPSELLLRYRTPAILEEIETAYGPDLVIFDMPPLLATDDTLAFLKHSDCALIIAAAEKTTTSQIDAVEKEIAEQTNVMGVILNQCIYMDGADGYYDYR